MVNRRLEFGLELGATDVGGVIAWLGVAEGAGPVDGEVLGGRDSARQQSRQARQDVRILGRANRRPMEHQGRGMGKQRRSMRLERGAIEAGPERPLTIATERHHGSNAYRYSNHRRLF